MRYREFGALNYNYIDLDGATGDTSVSPHRPEPEYDVLLPGELDLWRRQLRGCCSQSNFTTLNQTINCGRPFNVSVGSITTGSAVVSWDPLTVADTFPHPLLDRRYHQLLAISNTTAVDPIRETISNLLPNTTYQVRVSSICNGVSSGYCRPQVTFTTLNGPVSCVTPYGPDTATSPVRRPISPGRRWYKPTVS